VTREISSLKFEIIGAIVQYALSGQEFLFTTRSCHDVIKSGVCCGSDRDKMGAILTNN